MELLELFRGLSPEAAAALAEDIINRMDNVEVVEEIEHFLVDEEGFYINDPLGRRVDPENLDEWSARTVAKLTRPTGRPRHLRLV